MNHGLIFYEKAGDATHKVTDYLLSGLSSDEHVVIAARPSLWQSILAELKLKSVDYELLMSQGRLHYLSTDDILKELLVTATLDEEKFHALIAPKVRSIAKEHKVRVYGEIVDVLAEQEHFHAAEKLEGLWHGLQQECTFHLLCGYHMSHFKHTDHIQHFANICQCHSHFHEPEVKSVEVLSTRLHERLLHNAEIELQQKAKLISLGEMSAGLAHEINNPLAIIMAMTERLKELAPKDPETEKLLAMQERASERIAKIVKNIRMFSRQTVLEKKPFSLSRAIEFIVENVRDNDSFKGITLEAHIEPLIQVEGDRLGVEHVVYNLLNNARDAVKTIPAGEKKIVLSLAQTTQTSCLIQIQDSGPGIDEWTQQKIFTPFFTTKGETTGTGLGLSFSYDMVRKHGGLLSCHSKPHEGATFKVTLPSVKIV